MAVEEWVGTLIDWQAKLAEMKDYLAPALGRAETRSSAGAFIDGLLSNAGGASGRILRRLMAGFYSAVDRNQ